jgi:hypothetical protein
MPKQSAPPSLAAIAPKLVELTETMPIARQTTASARLTSARRLR